MVAILQLALSYSGDLADRSELDLYDAGQALIGFHRSLALTTHLVLHGEIITQAPSLRDARILSLPPRDGSWKTTAIVVIGAIYAAGSITKDSPIGNLISSAYDYVIHETLGFHVDYAKTLGQQYDEYKSSHPDIKRLSEPRFHSLSEKCDPAFRDMHRPILFSRTAEIAQISANTGHGERQIGVDFNEETADYIYNSISSDAAFEYVGQVTGYNTNTFKGRIYVESEYRILGFILDENCRSVLDLFTVTNSLTANAQYGGEYNKYKRIQLSAFTYRKQIREAEELAYNFCVAVPSVTIRKVALPWLSTID